MKLYQRGKGGFPEGGDNVTYKAYGPIPNAKLFQNGYIYEKPETVHGWQFSNDCNRWSALVTFKNGWHGFTYPKTYSR